MSSPTRPIVRYHGGKWLLAPWIISHFPAHRIYVEPFGGGASVLLRKPRCYSEVYNDLDDEMVNLFKVVRDNGEALRDALELTPFARTEYIEAWYPSKDPLEQARRTVIRSFMGFGSAAITMQRVPDNNKRGGLIKTGFRACSNRSGTTPAHDWKNYPSNLASLIQRLRGVVIENRDGIDCMLQHDTPETLHYVDPPYLPETRDAGGDYRHEMTNNDHERLAKVLHELEGTICLSGYRSELYDDLYGDWACSERHAKADGGRDRIECLWISRDPPQAQLKF